MVRIFHSGFLSPSVIPPQPLYDVLVNGTSPVQFDRQGQAVSVQ